jgi:1,4-alpha-glucan branching enzyme
MPQITELDLHLLAEGTHSRAYERLGAHVARGSDPPGVEFAVWAPHARSVAVIGDFNGWSHAADPMRKVGGSGIWERFIPGVRAGALYKYAIVSYRDGSITDKADPFSFASEEPPGTASRVWDLSDYDWGDATWMSHRAGTNAPGAPITIYEVHLGSWMRSPEQPNRWLTYREIAPKLADYAQEMGFTHVELMPVAEHPFYGSWGYQPVGHFAPTSRYGTPDDFRFLVTTLHRRGLGVILDWVPAHFPRDPHGLAVFDGTPLYEHADPRRGASLEWNTCLFDYGKPGVASFLMSSASFWLDKYHIDGLRVDAVTSMLYLDLARAPGEWVPNQFGGRENLEAISLLRRLNDRLHAEFPGAITIAEESTAWPAVSRPASAGGLGFDYKWDLGWTHDTLLYMRNDPLERKDHHTQLTFRGLYAFNESYVLPLSHDEVTAAKGSLLARMPGDDWQRAANLRLLYGFMFAQPGKKLMFMGDEFGQVRAWDHDSSLDWHLLDHPLHQGLGRWVRDLNTTYRAEPALHELDCHPDGFSWIDCNDVAQSVLCLLRRPKWGSDLIAVVCNFTQIPRHNYRVGVPRGGDWDEILNSDATIYGGSGQGNIGGLKATPVAWHGIAQSLNVTLPPLALVAFRSRR